MYGKGKTLTFTNWSKILQEKGNIKLNGLTEKEWMNLYLHFLKKNIIKKDFYRSLNPHEYWADGKKNVTCFSENKSFKKGTITYPFRCKNLSKNYN